jgi:hypothetical protein
VRRLELRAGYPHEVPDPDFLSSKILIDGREPLTWSGSRGQYAGPPRESGTDHPFQRP